MANQLKDQIKDLSSYIDQMQKLKCVKNAKGQEGKKLKTLLALITSQVELTNKEADMLDTAISARDLTIRSLGEKLAEIRSKQAKPFFVVGGDHDEREEREGPQIFKKGNMQKWDKKTRMSLQNEMLREMARLVTDPMGLEGNAREEMEEEIAANMKFQHLQRGNDIEEITKKTMVLIQAGEARKVPREKTRGFLLRKEVSQEIIDQCFARFDAEASIPRLTSIKSNELVRYDSENSELSEYDLDGPLLLDRRVSNSAA